MPPKKDEKYCLSFLESQFVFTLLALHKVDVRCDDCLHEIENRAGIQQQCIGKCAQTTEPRPFRLNPRLTFLPVENDVCFIIKSSV